MASSTALELVNRALITTGDYAKLNTVINSPADIAERIISFLNLVVADVGRIMDFPILSEVFNGISDGTSSKFQSSTGTGMAANSVRSCSVNGIRLELVTDAQLVSYRADGIAGLAQFFSITRLPTGELEADVFPTPASNLPVSIIASNDPSPFTLVDTSTTEYTGMDDILLLGVLQHMDAFDGLNRGYAKLYAEAKLKLYTHMNRNMQIRITPESYA